MIKEGYEKVIEFLNNLHASERMQAEPAVPCIM